MIIQRDKYFVVERRFNNNVTFGLERITTVRRFAPYYAMGISILNYKCTWCNKSIPHKVPILNLRLLCVRVYLPKLNAI